MKDKLIYIANRYKDAAEVDLAVLGENLNMLYDTRGCSGSCEFCHALKNCTELNIDCVNVLRYGSLESQRFGGKYIFFCPSGLVHFASPILINRDMKYAFVAGPVLLIDREEFVYDDLSSRFSISDEKAKELMDKLGNIPQLTTKKVESLSEILFMTTMQISDESSKKVLHNADVSLHQSTISSYVHELKKLRSKNLYPLDKENELLVAIEKGNKELSQKLLNEIFGYILFSSNGNFNTIKARVIELIVLLSRAAMNGGADAEQIFGMNSEYIYQINNFKSSDELMYWLSKVMNKFTDLVFDLSNVKHYDIISKAVNYIKDNYKEKLTLEDVANYVYLSTTYFSKIFNDEMKCNFNAYLNKIRIEESKKLLLNDNISLVEISNMIGYDEQSYFSKLFKKIVGVTPRVYREKRGKI